MVHAPSLSGALFTPISPADRVELDLPDCFARGPVGRLSLYARRHDLYFRASRKCGDPDGAPGILFHRAFGSGHGDWRLDGALYRRLAGPANHLGYFLRLDVCRRGDRL